MSVIIAVVVAMVMTIGATTASGEDTGSAGESVRQIEETSAPDTTGPTPAPSVAETGPSAVTGATEVGRQPGAGDTLPSGEGADAGGELLDAKAPAAANLLAPRAARHLVPTVPNPAMPERCGVNVAVVVDVSNSIGSDGLRQSKAAAKTVVDAVEASGGHFGLYAFATHAPADNNANLRADWMPVFDEGDAETAKDKIDSLRMPASNIGGTNWEGGLRQVLQSRHTYDFVYFITDGQPTTNDDYGQSRAPAGLRYDAGTHTHFDDVNDAIIASNRLKQEKGSYVIPVAVGLGWQSVPVYGNDVRSPSLWGVDHYQTPREMLSRIDEGYVSANNYDDLVATLNSVLQPCQATVVVEKEIVDADGNVIADKGPEYLAQGWDFTASDAPRGLGITAGGDGRTVPELTETTGRDGFTRAIELKSDTPSSAGTLLIEEETVDGYRIHQQDGGNAVCHIGDGVTFADATNFTPVPVTNEGAEGFRVPVEAGRTTHCVVQNVKPVGEVAIEKGPRPGDAVEVDADGTAELVYTVTVSNPGRELDVDTGEIRDVVKLPRTVVAGGVTVGFTADTGVESSGIVSAIPATSFVAGAELRLAENLRLPAGTTANFTVTVPVKVNASSEREWEELGRCESSGNEHVSGGVPNGVTIAGDTGDADGPGNNTACIPLVRVDAASVTVLKTDFRDNELGGAKFALHAAELDGTGNPVGPSAAPLIPDLPLSEGSLSRHVAGDLRAGHYYLIEVQAPHDYSLLSTPVGFSLERSDGPEGYTLSLLDPASHGHVVEIQDGLVLRIADTSSGDLPASGGFGAAPHALLAALVLLVGLAAARKTGLS